LIDNKDNQLNTRIRGNFAKQFTEIKAESQKKNSEKKSKIIPFIGNRNWLAKLDAEFKT
jgi:hypothetical protein